MSAEVVGVVFMVAVVVVLGAMAALLKYPQEEILRGSQERGGAWAPCSELVAEHCPSQPGAGIPDPGVIIDPDGRECRPFVSLSGVAVPGVFRCQQMRVA